MKIAVLSGKGGTGKTFVSVNMATASEKAVYVDCDIEEPNGHLFFKPKWEKEAEISVKLPEVDKDLCNGCRYCVDFCKFNALAYIKDRVLVFDEICHSCGGCKLICSQKAIKDRQKVIGKVREGKSEDVTVISGILDIGQMSGSPLIKNIMESIKDKEETVVIDCPPGSACIVMDSIKDADFCVIVAEPTAFGKHNLEMVFELVSIMKKPLGVILNKCVGEHNPSLEFCIENDIEVIGSIPFDEEIGKINSSGEIVAKKQEKYDVYFKKILDKIRGMSV